MSQSNYLLKDLVALEVFGKDTENFLQGQLTNDLRSLTLGHGQWQTRLDIKGLVKSYFYLIRESVEKFYIIIDKKYKDDLVEDLDKYLISEDVTFGNCLSIVSLSEKPASQDLSFQVIYFGNDHYINLNSDVDNIKEELSEELKEKSFYSGLPHDYDSKLIIGKRVNETFLNSIAVSYTKGCFLGQEVCAKIENNRKATYAPVLIKSKDKDLRVGDIIKSSLEEKVGEVLYVRSSQECIATVKRNYRLNNFKQMFIVNDQEVEVTINSLPHKSTWSYKDIAITKYEQAVQSFQDEDTETALIKISQSIHFDPDSAEYIEMKGVILGKNEKYEEAINQMELLLKVDPDSIMAHTNKSLYLMKLGKIEEAEDEKAKATLKEFKRLGKEAQSKKSSMQEEEAKKKQLESRISMFKEVLEIDPDDTIANYGLGEILLSTDIDQSETYFKKCLELDYQHPPLYLNLAKCYLKKNDKTQAKDILEKGLTISLKKGESNTAGEINNLLQNLD